MKRKIMYLISLQMLVFSGISAQDISSMVRKEISALDFLVGQWKGEGSMNDPQWGRSSSKVHEDIRFDLNGTILTMRGTGIAKVQGEDQVVHEALGVICYDPFLMKFEMHSWVARGFHTRAKEITVRDSGELIWSFEAGPGQLIRYSISVADGQWNEIGERSSDGLTWTRFFEMNLVKISE